MVVKLYEVKSEKYLDSVVRLFRTSTKNSSVLYVTANNPFQILKKRFETEKIYDVRKTFFIDCVSKSVNMDTPDTKECLLLDNPQNLTALGTTVSTALKQLFVGKKVILFLDSISALIAYNTPIDTLQFSNFLINKMKAMGIDSIFLFLDVDKDRELIKRITVLCDEIVPWHQP